MKQIPKTLWVFVFGSPLLITLDKAVGKTSPILVALVGWCVCILLFGVGIWEFLHKRKKLMHEMHGVARVAVYKHGDQYVITPYNIRLHMFKSEVVFPQESIRVRASTLAEITAAVSTALELSANNTNKETKQKLSEQMGYTSFPAFFKEYDLVHVKKFTDRYLLQRTVKCEGKYLTITDEKDYTLELANPVSSAEIVTKVSDIFDLPLNNVPVMEEITTQGGQSVKYLLPIRAALSEITREDLATYKTYCCGTHILSIINIELENANSDNIYAKWTQKYGELLDYHYHETNNPRLPYLALSKTAAIEIVAYFYADVTHLLCVQYQIDLSATREEIADIRAGFEAIVTSLVIETDDELTEFGYYTVSESVLDGKKIRYCYRQYPNYFGSNGWVLLSDLDKQEHCFDWKQKKLVHPKVVNHYIPAAFSIFSAKYGTMLRWLYDDDILSGFYDLHAKKRVTLAEIILNNARPITIVKAKNNWAVNDPALPVD